ncbi:MAG: Gfo/Idh/MocA family protein [Victivallaceae bacterium]
MTQATQVGVIGCGNISDAYFNAAKNFSMIRITKVADLNMAAARDKAEKHGFEAVTVEALLADPAIAIVLNLTTPQSHTEVNTRILKAGKHAYTEKPFGLDRASGAAVLKLAAKLKLRTGGAPDTFLGGAHQTCRALIDEGRIGKVVAGTAFMMCHGHESWHPNPGFYYLKGGGPLFDMGPYYLTALVNMLGPVRKVAAINSRAADKRTATTPSIYGRELPVEVNTHVAGVLEFVSGAVITLVMSFDVWRHTNHNIELHGTAGSLRVPDPNCFGGKVEIFQPWLSDWAAVKLTHGYTDNMRSIGLADLARSLNSKVPARCSGELAFHVLDVMCALEEAAAAGKSIELASSCERPAALPLNLPFGSLGK